MANGEKPEIRVASEHSLFNVTNYARFQDLDFDGLDMLVSSDCDWSYVPTQKCQFTAGDDLFSVIHELSFVEQAASEDCPFTCVVDGYSPSEILDFTMANQDCTASSAGIQGTPTCSGLPNHDDYFTEANGIFWRRHTTLFNMYTFDTISSTILTVPTLELVNCEFRNFLTNTESLINIEVNNLVFYEGVTSDSDVI